jgi:hypothetical protein
MSQKNSGLRTAIAYFIVVVFAVLFVTVNWSGPGKILSLVSVVVLVFALCAIQLWSFAVAVGAAILVVALPFVAIWTNAGSATGVIGPLALFTGVTCWRTRTPQGE